MHKGLLFFLISILLLSGCATTAGPFVTNISSDGKGNLIIEKSNVEYNPWMGVVTNKNSTSATIKVIPEKSSESLP